MTRILVLIAGYICLAFGIAGLLTPVPVGIIFMVLAALLLIPTSPRAARALRCLRTRSSRIDRGVTDIARRVPSPYRRILQKTEVEVSDRRY